MDLSNIESINIRTGQVKVLEHKPRMHTTSFCWEDHRGNVYQQSHDGYAPWIINGKEIPGCSSMAAGDHVIRKEPYLFWRDEDGSLSYCHEKDYIWFPIPIEKWLMPDPNFAVILDHLLICTQCTETEIRLFAIDPVLSSLVFDIFLAKYEKSWLPNMEATDERVCVLIGDTCYEITIFIR